MQEIQIENILTKAKNLQKIMSNDLARKVLEIDLNADSSRNEDLLIRLIKSLSQYINKEQTLLYLGFVGHYSSGKSSTINKLLTINNTVDERATGLNPTDKAITLITDVKNSNALILLNRESGNVPVRSILIHNAELEKLVMADTPGSGDPQVVNELIQDFLPICDYILYFISAANPIDQADIPLLQQKAKKLPFIPIIFVITRTDEFRINKIVGLNSENINLSKKDVFTGQLFARIKEIVNSDEITIDDFIFIDNEFDFNLNELKEKIHDWTNNSKTEELLRIHGYKVEYYRKNLETIYTHFLKSIDNKISQSKEFLKTANDNITRFDKSVEMNNEKLKILWAKSDTSFKHVYLEETKFLDDLKQAIFPTDLSLDRLVQMERRTISQNIENLANGYLGRAVADLNNHFRQRIRDVKHNIFENINSGDILMENISHLFPGRLDFNIATQTIDIDFIKINDYTKAYLDATRAALGDVKNALKTRISQFKSQISKDVIKLLLDELYQSGKTNIDENFDQYFDRIQMYKNAVLTKNTKQTIEKLRIGRQLDDLDDEFTDDFTIEMKEKALSEVYTSNHTDIKLFEENIERINISASQLRMDIENIKLDTISKLKLLDKESIDISDFQTTVTTKVEEIVNVAYQTRLHEVAEKHLINYKSLFKNRIKGML